ncbi:MAG: tRNA uridine-5-carboxymethylaminomethyl(34) synthesis GTPase MnmE [Clostridia bacterium]|nr:tRNA uridine-5-carboxymethylaminomethyl(34) synthesis GTPase MnmE [Clostridia bacterium]
MSTICALSTPRGVGGIAVVRVSGEQAINICAALVRPIKQRLEQVGSNRTVFAKVYDDEKTLDEVMVTVFRAPHSFTGEDTVEISCHGGIYITERLLTLLLAQGCVMAAAGEFTKRAYLNGKLDLAQAEAVIDLIHARSPLQARNALGQLDGRLSRKVSALRAALCEIGTEIMAYVDYPEETIGEIDEASITQRLSQNATSLEKLLRSFDMGHLIREGIPTAIIGKPNVGKSTLMNALLGKDKSIVTDIAGTTRDTVEESALVGDMVLHLMDTAGIRETSDTVEAIGVERARAAAESAALVIALIDGSRPPDDEDKAILSIAKEKRSILIINKSDLPQQAELTDLAPVIRLSAKNEDGLEALHQAIRAMFKTETVEGESLNNLRQRQAVSEALVLVQSALSAMESGLGADMAGLDVTSAAEALATLTGESVREQMIEDIFSRFCVGK